MTVPAVRETVTEDTLRYLGLDPRDVATRALVLVANRYDLDPLIGQILLMPTRNGARVYVTRDGMIAIAHRSGQLDGIVVDEQRRNTQNDGWTTYVSVWRKDCSHPFRYGAQCKDSEPQAKAGHGLEMALARAERRALTRAFAIPADFYPGADVIDDGDMLEVESVPGPGGIPPSPAGDSPTGGPVGAGEASADPPADPDERPFE
jgi:RecT family